MSDSTRTLFLCERTEYVQGEIPVWKFAGIVAQEPRAADWAALRKGRRYREVNVGEITERGS